MQSKLKLLRVSKAVNDADLADLSLIEAVCSEIHLKRQEKIIQNDTRSYQSIKQQNNPKQALRNIQTNNSNHSKDGDELEDAPVEVDHDSKISTIIRPIHRRLPIINVIPYQGFPGTIQEALETACQIYVSQHPEIVHNISTEANSMDQQSAHEILQRRKLSELSVWRKEIMKTVDNSRPISNSYYSTR